jgi:hypothetical protein
MGLQLLPGSVTLTTGDVEGAEIEILVFGN